MTILSVSTGGRYNVSPLYQWDKNQTLEITGLIVPRTPEIHFVNKSMSEALVRQARTDKNGVITVDIPNLVLESILPVDVYVCAYDGDLFHTLYALQIPVKARKKPSDYIYEKEEEVLSFNALNNRLTDTIVEMRTLINNAVATVNKKYTDTYESLVIKCDETLEELTTRCKNYLAQLTTKCDETLAQLRSENETMVQAFTEAVDERIQSVKNEIQGDTATSLDNRITETNTRVTNLDTALKSLVTTINNLSIATTAWSNKTYTISSSLIKDGSIVDIYYNSASKALMADAEPTYTVSAGKIVITVVTVPTSTVVIDCVKVVNDV